MSQRTSITVGQSLKWFSVSTSNPQCGPGSARLVGPQSCHGTASPRHCPSLSVGGFPLLIASWLLTVTPSFSTDSMEEQCEIVN